MRTRVDSDERRLFVFCPATALQRDALIDLIVRHLLRMRIDGPLHLVKEVIAKVVKNDAKKAFDIPSWRTTST